MSTVLRLLAHQPNGTLAGRAFCDFRSFVLTGVMSENQVALRLIVTSTLPSSDAREAINRGFNAAKGKRS